MGDVVDFVEDEILDPFEEAFDPIVEGIFGAFFDTPDIPDPLQPTTPENLLDPTVKAYRDQAKAAARGVQKSTIHTSPLGVTTENPTTNKKLLGN
jgi:hypothetical protein